MAVDKSGRRFYQPSELKDGTYEFRGEREPESEKFISKAGYYIYSHKEVEYSFIDYFRKIFTGCDWQKVYPLTQKDLAQIISGFLKERKISLS